MKYVKGFFKSHDGKVMFQFPRTPFFGSFTIVPVFQASGVSSVSQYFLTNVAHDSGRLLIMCLLHFWTDVVTFWCFHIRLGLNGLSIGLPFALFHLGCFFRSHMLPP